MILKSPQNYYINSDYIVSYYIDNAHSNHLKINIKTKEEEFTLLEINIDDPKQYKTTKDDLILFLEYLIYSIHSTNHTVNIIIDVLSEYAQWLDYKLKNGVDNLVFGPIKR